MTGMTNPWIPVPEPETVAPELSSQEALPSWGPQAGIQASAGWLPFVLVEGPARVNVVGAHGGAGATTLAGLLDGRDCGAAWPITSDGVRQQVIVCARTSFTGLKAAQAVAMQWASGCVPAVDLAGLVLLADAPGKLPRDLVDLQRHVSGAFACVWHLEWVPEARTTGQITRLPKHSARVIEEIGKGL